jgi:hypothetical protein
MSTSNPITQTSTPNPITQTTSPLDNLDATHGDPHTTGFMGSKAIKHLDRMNWAIRVFVVVAIISLIATIILSGLALFEYLPPHLPLYSFSACIASFLVMKAIDCCQQSVAKKNGGDLQQNYYSVRQPLAKKEDEKKK